MFPSVLFQSIQGNHYKYVSEETKIAAIFPSVLVESFQGSD